MIKKFDELLPGDVVYLPRWKELAIIQWRRGWKSRPNPETDFYQARFVDSENGWVALHQYRYPLLSVVAHRGVFS